MLAAQTPALYGGTPVKTTPYGTGRRFGVEELAQLEQALAQNTLFYWAGSKVKQFARTFADMYGLPYCVTTSSGTAAIHTALGALGVTAGDEVITSPITDMGSVIGILYQNAVPVFADVDPHTYNMTAAAIEACITPKTKAILVVHLAGNPADMDAIMAVAKKHGVYVVEDCAQSYNARYKGRLVGTIGDIGCFSINEFKHISAGDGGMLIMRDEALYNIAHRFADKNYDRLATGGAMRAIESLAPNYRMNELTGAVGLAQLGKLDDICARYARYGNRLLAGLDGIAGLALPKVLEGCESTHWFFMTRIDAQTMGCDRDDFADALAAEGIKCSAGYLASCVYEYGLFTNQNAYPGTHCPFDCPHHGGGRVAYGKGLCPDAERVLETALNLPVNPFFTDEDCDQTIAAIRKVAAYFAGEGRGA